jgi:hypothetical protein
VERPPAVAGRIVFFVRCVGGIACLYKGHGLNSGAGSEDEMKCKTWTSDDSATPWSRLRCQVALHFQILGSFLMMMMRPAVTIVLTTDNVMG